KKIKYRNDRRTTGTCFCFPSTPAELGENNMSIYALCTHKGVLHDHNYTCGWALLLSNRMEEVVQRCLRSERSAARSLTYADLRPPRALLLFLSFCFATRPPCDTTIHHDDGEKEENRKTTNRRLLCRQQQYTTTAASIS
ncbi:unnamed protein product, partial [Laminaria digitata]